MSHQQRRALVVDDSMLIRYAVCRFLEEHGFAVESVSNGIDALSVLERFTPSIIFTDLDMPRMGGRELIDVLKLHPRTREIPLVVLSGQNAAAEPRADLLLKKDQGINDELPRVLEMLMSSV